jgi:hypothetical protein
VAGLASVLSVVHTVSSRSRSSIGWRRHWGRAPGRERRLWLRPSRSLVTSFPVIDLSSRCLGLESLDGSLTEPCAKGEAAKLSTPKRHARLTRLPAMRFLNNVAIARGARETPALEPITNGRAYSNSMVRLYCESGDRRARRCDRFKPAARDGARQGPGVIL